jgi:hypothetical protein
MTAVRAILEPKSAGSSRRTADRRKLHLPTEGVTTSGTSEVLILNVSKTGLLLETSGDLSEGETIELDFPEATGVRAVVKWSSGSLFGCKFQKPLTRAALSAALLRASFDPPKAEPAYVSSELAGVADHQSFQSDHQGELSVGAKLRWIIGLTILLWACIIAAASLLWG